MLKNLTKNPLPLDGVTTHNRGLSFSISNWGTANANANANLLAILRLKKKRSLIPCDYLPWLRNHYNVKRVFLLKILVK